LTVNIVGLPGGVTQSLPISYIQNFQRWLVQDGQIRSRVCDSKISEIEWQAPMQIRPTFDVLIKSGVPSYVMAGLQVQGNGQKLCPLARQWTTFSFAVEPNFRVEAFTSHGGEGKAALDLGGNPAERMKNAMELFGIAFSQLGDGSSLNEGFHIVSIPLGSEWKTLPSPEKGPYVLTCLATAEPEAEELLTMDPGLAEMTASSIMELRVVPSDATSTCSEPS
jgi:hypothetical protein